MPRTGTRAQRRATRRGRPKQKVVTPKPPPEAALRESRGVDFKQGINLGENSDWCELIKDVVAMANSGGGAIVVGVKDDGDPSGTDCSPLLTIDPAKVVDKIANYTGGPVPEFEIRGAERRGHPVAVMEVHAAFPPLVFVRPGGYDVMLPDGKKKTKAAFAAGTVYFRHGAKSEPANSHDLRNSFERRVDAERKALMSNVSKVVHKPAGAEVRIIPAGLATSGDEKAVPVRLVNDPRAPALRSINPDETHPFRQTELLAELNKRLKGKTYVNAHDAQCVRKIHNTDADPAFCYKSKFGSRQYSEAYLKWILERYTADPEFFNKARSAAYRLGK